MLSERSVERSHPFGARVKRRSESTVGSVLKRARVIGHADGTPETTGAEGDSRRTQGFEVCSDSVGSDAGHWTWWLWQRTAATCASKRQPRD